MTSSCSLAEYSSPSPSSYSHITTPIILQTVVITALVTCIFVITKSSYDQLRLRRSRATVVVIGAGPAGLLSALIVAQTGKASQIIIYEEKTKLDLVTRTKYVSFNGRSLKFLRSIGLEIQENLAGSWQHQCFATTTGILLGYLLNIIQARYEHLMDIRLGTKFTKESLKELDAISERIVAVVCDGSCGRSACLLGLSDEFTQHSCRSYGAVATIDHRAAGAASLPPPPPPPPAVVGLTEIDHVSDNHHQQHNQQQQQLLLQEVRVHHLTIDLNNHYRGGEDGSSPGQNDPFPTSFHLKIFGGSSLRSVVLAVPRCESSTVRTLKVIHDQSVMRDIFHECYNKYRMNSEWALSDSAAVKCMKYSPRLFEIKLLQRMEAAAYIEDADIFVITEGHAARRVNFDSGMDINLVISGLVSLGCFVQRAVWVDSEKTILQTLTDKLKHGRSVSEDFIKHGLKEVMYS